MRTITERILLTVFGIPLFFSSIVLFPHWGFAAFTLVVLIFSILGSYESASLVFSGTDARPLIHPFWVGIIPLSTYLQVNWFDQVPLTIGTYGLLFLYILGSEALKSRDDSFVLSRLRISGSIMTLLYPSALTVFVIQMTTFEKAPYWIIGFFLLIFANDVFAYVFGMLFGRSSKKPFAVSPNKSVVGYVGGGLSSLVVAALYYLLLPTVGEAVSLPLFLTAAAALSIAANIGDLAESVLKRSSGHKDSGSLIPGRGGVLDTIDSIVFSAPVYYLILYLILKV